MTLDDTLFPLIIVTSRNEITERDVDDLELAFEHVFARGERFAVVTRSSTPKFPSSNVRTRIAAWANKPSVHLATARYNVGHCYVLESAVVRGAMTAIHWLWDPPNPQHAAATYDEAVEWALGRLVTTGCIDAADAMRMRHAALSVSA